MDKNFSAEEIEGYFSGPQRGEVYQVVVERTEKLLIEKALEHCSGNQIEAARILGINRNTLRSKIRKFHIDVERFKLVHS